MARKPAPRAGGPAPQKKGDDEKGSALPRAWLVPMRLAIYAVLAASSGYVYFNVGELDFSHYLVLISIVAVAAMALLDCKMSEQYWRKQDKLAEQADAEDSSRDGTS